MRSPTSARRSAADVRRRPYAHSTIEDVHQKGFDEMRRRMVTRTASAVLAGVLSLSVVACSNDESDEIDEERQEVENEVDEERDEVDEEILEEKVQILDG